MLVNIFLSVLNISLSTSIVILFLLLLSRILDKRYTARLRVILWLLVAVRLLVPFGFSLPKQQALQFTIPKEFVNPFSNSSVLENNRLPAPTNVAGNDMMLGGAITPIQIIAFIWLVGATCLLLVHIYASIRFSRRLYRYKKVPADMYLSAFQQETGNLGLKRSPRLCCTSIIQTPVLTGLLRPVLYLPQKEYPPEELSFILRHELVHFKNRDLWIKLFSMVAVAIHWFNPLVWLLSHKVKNDIELACDAATVRVSNKEQRAVYGKIILSGSAKTKWTGHQLATHFGSPKRQTEKRIRGLFDFRPKRRGFVMVAVMLAATLFAGSLVACVQQENSNSDIPQSDARGFVGEDASSENTSGTLETPAEKSNVSGKVYFDNVSIELYDDDPGAPYIKDNFTNDTNGTMIGWSIGMLAFDKEGNPVQVDWYEMDSGRNRSYENVGVIEPYLDPDSEYNVAPGETFDVYGGWSIFAEVNEKGVCAVEYVLYCFKDITFADGTIWTNPDYDNWMEKYRAQKVDVKELESYYPVLFSVIVQ